MYRASGSSSQSTKATATLRERVVRLDRFLRRHRRAVLVAATVVLLAALPFASRQSERLSSGGFSAHGSGSMRVQEAVARSFPALPRSQVGVVIEGGGEGLPARTRQAIKLARGVRGITVAAADARRALAMARAGDTVVLQAGIHAGEDDAPDVAEELQRALAPVAGNGVRVRMAGAAAEMAALREVAKGDLEGAERIGFPIIVLVLLLAFGSAGASALPLGIGAFSVVVTGALIFFLSGAVSMSVYATNMASMIGIGVAVDYSLFVVTRYREERSRDVYRAAARSRALTTSGIAVAFSGVTVVLALAGLWLVPTNAVRSMGLGAMLVVAVSVVSAMTLLPVLMQRLGHAAYVRPRWHVTGGLLVRALGYRRRRRGSSRRPGGGFWGRWTARITSHPWLVVIASTAALVTLALPALDMRTGDSMLDQLPQGHSVRLASSVVAERSGPGALAPVAVVSPPGAAAAVRRGLRATEHLEPLGPSLVAPDGHSALTSARLDVGPHTGTAVAAVESLRAKLPPNTAVGGTTATEIDVRDAVSGSMWKVFAFVLGLSFVVLVVLLRSIVLPLKAILMNLLSIGAAYGVLVVVFQWGWLDGFAGFRSTGEISTLTPPLVLAVVFGLSMDYEIFLLSRIRERYDATGDNRRAVAEALASSARTISSAALIMTAVFTVFVFTGVPTIKELGLGNAVAIAVDATVVRLLLVPAAMMLLGDWNWWLPGPLARRLPRMELEPASPRPGAAT